MVRNFIGYLLTGAGFIGLVFFKDYNGDWIPHATLLFYSSYLLLAIGFYLSIKLKTTKEKTAIAENFNNIKLLQERGEKIVLDIDFCEFKKNDFQQAVESESTTRV